VHRIGHKKSLPFLHLRVHFIKGLQVPILLKQGINASFCQVDFAFLHFVANYPFPHHELILKHLQEPVGTFGLSKMPEAYGLIVQAQ